MEVKANVSMLVSLIKRYKIPVLVLLIGIALMLIPSNITVTKDQTQIVEQLPDLTNQLEQTIAVIEGVGQVKVLLSVGKGEETIFQTDVSQSSGSENSTLNTTTVIVTDADREQIGLVRQINPVAYQGAVVVCQGADDPQVRLNVVDAVSKATGLGANQISVLKMK